MPIPLQRLLIVVAAAALGVAAAMPAGARAASAEQQIDSGTLTFLDGTPGDLAFQPITLDGFDQTTTPATPQNLRVQDARGVADGWKIDLLPTRFAQVGNPTRMLPADALSVPAAPGASVCLPSSTCTPATNLVSYALPVEAAPAAATTIYRAAPGTGRGQLGFDVAWQLRIPASTMAGTYTSTWTYTLGTAP